jgi:diaminohydroxyphosphoribosylaminopyrimidine deaminase / 5-amino-6-(5-phosphoribosylamino)uracil reductase
MTRILARARPIRAHAAKRGRGNRVLFDRAVAEFFMRLALRQAEKGLGRTSPNPAVGAVLVKKGRVIARGYHARAGAPHAEVAAIRAAGARGRGADLYTTLEPCDHFGKTPPCSRAIIEAGVNRVYVGSRDPNPLVNGRGIARLRRAGIQVHSGILREKCDALNAAWFHYITTGRPQVTLKAAVTLDGKIATRTGDSRWVTGIEARREVHRLRNRVDAVLVGAGTARTDDPQLTTRLSRGGRDPVRVVLDSRLRLPRGLEIFGHRSGAPTIVAYVHGKPRSMGAGVEFLRCRARGGQVDLPDLLDKLARRGVTSLLVEGGAEVHQAFLEAGLADRVLLFLAPKIVGGQGISWVAGPGACRMAEALQLEEVQVSRVGRDILVTGRPAYRTMAQPRASDQM